MNFEKLENEKMDIAKLSEEDIQSLRNDKFTVELEILLKLHNLETKVGSNNITNYSCTKFGAKSSVYKLVYLRKNQN